MSLATVIRAQMLNTLFDVLDQGQAMAALQKGEAIQGKVMRPPDAQGQVLVAFRGETLRLQLSPQQLQQTIAPQSPASTLGQAKTGESLNLAPGASVTIRLDAATGGLQISRPALNGSGGTMVQADVPPAASQPTIKPSASTVQLAAALGQQGPNATPLATLFQALASSLQAAADGPKTQSVLATANALVLDGDAAIEPRQLREAVQLQLPIREVTSPIAQPSRPASPILELLGLLKAEIKEWALTSLPPTQPTKPDGSQQQQAPALTGTPSSSESKPSQGTLPKNPTATEDLPKDPIKLIEQAETRIQARHALAMLERGPDTLRIDQPQPVTAEVPIVYQGKAVPAELHFERDRDGGQEQDQPPLWQARIALDFEEIGMVHARAALMGNALAATLWAEDRQTVRLFQEAADELQAALSEAGFEVREIRIKDGKPPKRPIAIDGHYLKSTA
jgi:hypothetical protein